ncbi:MAG TPA: replication factor C large subunit [Candidatus Thermoplasmatota archaeon]|nr:replication factor C large subunit [Candidatus Thermoplasmatota archaeon]
MEDWTEKYRPKHLHEIIGNERGVRTLRQWAEKWDEGKTPSKRAVVLAGKPGTGKTSTALALANDFNWTVVELNASDARNEAIIKKIATAGAVNETLDDFGNFSPSREGGRKLIILDEADNLYEKIEGGGELGDRGGKKAIVETIQQTKQPIVLIVNDYYDLVKGGGEPLKQLALLIQFYEVNPSQNLELLKRICVDEGITADVKALRTIADRSKGDIRSAVNDLQSLAINRKQLDMDALDILGYRDRETVVFDALREVFKGKSLQASRDCLRDVDVPPETMLLWIDENLPREYLDTGDLAKGYEAVSLADVFFGRVQRRQYYDLWSYGCDLMSAGVSVAKTHNYGNMQYAFPVWMKQLKSLQTPRMTRDGVARKLGALTHASLRKTKEAFLPTFQMLFRNDTRFACKMITALDLSEGEVRYLLGEKHQHKMKEILECSEKTNVKQEEIVLQDTTKKEEQKEPKDEKTQPSIFDF